jgi:hypothetical protein
MERTFPELPPLTSPVFDFSLSKRIAQSNRERSPKRRRGFTVDFSGRSHAPAVDLAPNAGMLYVHLNDAVAAVARDLLDSRESVIIEEILDGLATRQFFDPAAGTYVTPSSLTADHLSFLLRHDPALSAVLELDDRTIRRRSSLTVK